jgi:alginate O-acetyltransferase complex protein AlgI
LFENRLRNLTLLIFSYLFYLFGAPDFICFWPDPPCSTMRWAACMDRFEGQKRLWLTLSVVVNLGLLAWFKYANFMVAQTADQLARMGIDLSGWERWPCRWASLFSPSRSSATRSMYTGGGADPSPI